MQSSTLPFSLRCPDRVVTQATPEQDSKIPTRKSGLWGTGIVTRLREGN